jgi:hypothetical protein
MPGANDLELLKRHRPVFLWDSQEDYRAVSAETIVVNPGNLLKRGQHVLAGASGEGGRQLTLELLCRASTDIRPRKKDRLVEAAPPLSDARRLQADARYANTVHGEVVRCSKHISLRYWIWLYYTSQHLLGRGRHEGSWQLVEVTLDETDAQPIAVTYSQVKGERRRRMNEVQWRSCATACSRSCRHPVVYVAPFSHDCYFEAGTHIVLPFSSATPNGEVDEGLPRVVPLGAWKDWPGSWGGTRPIYGFSVLGTSPRSPGHQKHLWKPRRGSVPPLHRRWRWKLGARFSPLAPTIASVVCEADFVIVAWCVQRPLLRRVRWLLITLHQGENPERLVCRRSVRVRSDAGQTRLVLGSLATDPVVVKASAFNGIAQRSDVIVAQETHNRRPQGIGASSPRDEWSPRVWKAFRRQLLSELVERGAATIEELEQRQFHVLELALDRAELTAVVESARRHGLVKGLGDAEASEDKKLAEIEWAPTEEGRKCAQRTRQWAANKAQFFLSPVIVVAVGSALWRLVTTQDLLLAIIVGMVSLSLVWFAIVFLHRYAGGAARPSRAIATQWSRHAVELPFLNQYSVRKSTRIVSWVVIAVGAAVYSAAVILEFPEILRVTAFVLVMVGEVVVLATTGGIGRFAETRAIRRTQIAREERDRTTEVPAMGLSADAAL